MDLIEHRCTLSSDFVTYKSRNVLVWCACDPNNPLANLHDATPAELWRVEQRHLSELAAATRSTAAGTLVQTERDG